MSNFDLIRAWKDEDFSSSLSVPESPVGDMELLSDEEMELLSGGINNVNIYNRYGDNNTSIADNYSYCDVYVDNGYGYY